MNSEGPCAPGNQPEKEKEIERKSDMWRPSIGEQGPSLYFQRELLYLELYIEQSEKCRVMQSQLNIPSALTFIDTRFFPAYCFINKGLIFCTLSSGPEAC